MVIFFGIGDDGVKIYKDGEVFNVMVLVSSFSKISQLVFIILMPILESEDRHTLHSLKGVQSSSAFLVYFY
jgi:hypothetical protein